MPGITATVTTTPTRTGRTYQVDLSDGRSFKRSSTREKTAIHCPMDSRWLTSTTIKPGAMVDRMRRSGTAGTVVDLQTGQVLFHRSQAMPPLG